MSVMRGCKAAGAAVLMGVAALAGGGDVPPPDVYRVTADVRLADPPRFSVNVDSGAYAPWDVDRRMNVWNRMASCEPLQFQHNGIADGGGDDYLEHRNAPGLSYWDCARSGFWDGATVTVYRVADDALKVVRQAVVSRSVMGLDAAGGRTEERAYFAAKGPAVRAGDLYVLRMVRDRMPAQMRPNLFPRGAPSYDGIVDRQGDVQWRIDSATFCPEGGSTASLRMDCRGGTPARPAGLWHWFMVTNATDVQFFPGRAYRLQAWLRQRGASDGQVHVQVGTITNLLVEVGDAWRKVEVDLPVAAPQSRYQAMQGDGTRLLVGMVGEGTVWVDNLLVYQADTPPFAVLPPYVEQLKAWHPQVLRLWGGFDAPSLDAWLEDGFRQPTRGGLSGSAGPAYTSLGTMLRLCREVGAEPWLILNPFFSDAELAGLMEYLGGPADRGYGTLRARQGQVEPWTQVFARIRFECGNEAWNGIFSPRAWPGNPALYARIADREFGLLKRSPYYRPAAFECIANGWDSSLNAGGWTHRLAQASREADRLDIAMYFGGWEKGQGGDDNGDGVYQDRLLATPIEYGPKLLGTLLLDPGLFGRFGAALATHTALVSAALADYRGTTPDSSVPHAAGLAPEALLDSILTCDPPRLAAVAKPLSLRQDVEKPAWDIARRVLATHPSFQPRAAQCLGIDAEAAGRIVLALNNLGGAPGTMTDLVHKQPALVDGLLAAIPFTPDETNTLRRAASGGPLDYGVVNRIGKRVNDDVADYVAASNADFLAAMGAEVSEAAVRPGADIVAYSAGASLSRACASFSEPLLKAMKSDPAFAATACRAFQARPDLFRAVAQGLAGATADALQRSFEAPFEVTPWGPKLLMFKALPTGLVARIAAASVASVDGPAASSPREARLMARACYSLAGGDPSAVVKLAAEPALAAALSERMRQAVLEAFFEAAGRDARVGDGLLAALQAVPPGAGAKGLAVYEGGPGYSLPGPGKRPPVEDESMGKSLVSGTATLDAFMLALSQGVAPVCYYNFKSGSYWASHKHPLDPVPYPTWLALQLRNRYAAGALLRVEPVQVSTVDIPDKKVVATTNDGKGSGKLVRGRKGVPWTACYAFRDGKRYAFLLINRDLGQVRAVRLELPYAPQARARLHLLTHPDPRADNRHAAVVTLSEREVEGFGNGFVLAVPPASACVLVNEAR